MEEEVLQVETRGAIRLLTLNRPKKLNALNEDLLIRLHESGVAAPSYTTLNGQHCLRAALSNHRTRAQDLLVSVEAVRMLGRKLAAAPTV